MVRRARHNLPTDLSRFVGREAEIAEIEGILRSNRLLTLAGFGGVGKTRLALKVAADVADQYRDGVWLVELAPVTDPARVPEVVALALAVPEQPGRPLHISLVDALGARQVLLVLDNCEHLVSACAELVETLLRACPEMRVLATSRQSLRVPGETTWRVPPLTLPSSGATPTRDSLIRYDATRLFLDRAAAALPGLVVTDAAAATIARVCSRLDGIPFAIELATARLAVLSLAQIDRRLDDRLRLLTEGNRTRLPRQQTLRATLDWSFDLLSEKERALFRRVAVFAGGWTLEAAEAVGSGDGVPAEEVLDLLGSLVDKSLVIADEPGASKRYRLLEVARQYASEVLRASGEEAAVRDRHRDWFLALGDEADGRIRGVEQASWLDRLEQEHDNLRAALTWCLAEGRDGEAGLRLAAALSWFWRLRGHLSEGRRWLDLALAAPARGMGAIRSRALCGAGLLAVAQGDDAAAEAFCEESLRLAREGRDETQAAWALHGLGRVAVGTRDFDRATALLGESLASFRAQRDAAGCAYTLHFLADVPREHGDFARAIALDLEGLAAAREAGDTCVLGWTLAHLGNLVFLQGEAGRAGELLAEGLSLLSAIRDPWGIAVCLMALTGLAGARGQPERAARLFGAQQALRERLGTTTPPTGPSAYQRGLDAARASLGAGRFEASAGEGRAMSLDEAIAYALAGDADRPLPGGPKGSAEPSPLTAREREVAALVAEGFSNRAIADALVIAPRTVETHVSNILGKLDLHSRAQIAAWAVEHGLVASRHPRSATTETT